MPKPNRLVLAKDAILLTFSNAPKKVYFKGQLADVLLHNRRIWHLADHTTAADFISFLMDHGKLQVREFRSETYGKTITRYSWGNASPLELAQSINARGYLCHATAAMLHGLAKLSTKMIYLNVEQSAKPSSDGPLTQDGIARAFSGKQRQSNLIYTHDGVSVVMISGKNTNRLGIEGLAGPKSESLQVTNLERTLIDIIVRPAYGGGISHVLKAYRAGKDRVSVNQLITILKKLDYLYPYHQPIGFVMQKAGYPKKDCRKLRALGVDKDFYLTHGLHEPAYSEDWRLFYPRDLG